MTDLLLTFLAVSGRYSFEFVKDSAPDFALTISGQWAILNKISSNSMDGEEVASVCGSAESLWLVKKGDTPGVKYTSELPTRSGKLWVGSAGLTPVIVSGVA